MANKYSQEDYEKDAQVVFDKAARKSARFLEAELAIAKTLVTSILALNTTGLAAVLYRASSGSPTYAVTGVWFLIGILLALLLAFFTWVNYAQNSDQHDNYANYKMLRDHSAWPENTDFSHITFTYYCAIAAGFLSVAAFVAGIIHVWNIASN